MLLHRAANSPASCKQNFIAREKKLANIAGDCACTDDEATLVVDAVAGSGAHLAAG
jgi:hypothetical protein